MYPSTSLQTHPKKFLFIKQIFFTCFVKMGRKIVLIFSHLVNLKYNCIVAELLIGFFLQNRRSNCIELSIMHKVPKLQIASFKTFWLLHFWWLCKNFSHLALAWFLVLKKLVKNTKVISNLGLKDSGYQLCNVAGWSVYICICKSVSFCYQLTRNTTWDLKLLVKTVSTNCLKVFGSNPQIDRSKLFALFSFSNSRYKIVGI